MRLLRALGDNEANHVICNVGWEQEFFLVDRENYLARPDLVSCGRALIGNLPARAQQASLNYFGRMPSVHLPVVGGRRCGAGAGSVWP